MLPVHRPVGRTCRRVPTEPWPIGSRPARLGLPGSRMPARQTGFRLDRPGLLNRHGVLARSGLVSRCRLALLQFRPGGHGPVGTRCRTDVGRVLTGNAGPPFRMLAGPRPALRVHRGLSRCGLRSGRTGLTDTGLHGRRTALSRRRLGARLPSSRSGLALQHRPCLPRHRVLPRHTRLTRRRLTPTRLPHRLRPGLPRHGLRARRPRLALENRS